MAPPIPHINLELTDDNIPDVVEHAIKLLRSEWNVETSVHHRSSDGFVNITVIVSSNGVDMCDALVLRTLSAIGGDIANQMLMNKFLHDNDLGPGLLAFLDNGVVMKFVKGSVMKWKDWMRLYEPKVWKPIARSLARWHQKRVYEKAVEVGVVEAECLLWGDFVRLNWEKALAMPEVQPYLTSLPNRANLLNAEKEVIRRLVEQSDVDKRLCHLDVNLSNIAYEEEQSIATFIDFDYVSITYLQLDLSWYFHICQDIETASLDIYPNEEYRTAFLTEYLQHRHLLDGEPEPSENDIRKLLVQVEKMRLINFLRSVASGPAALYSTSQIPGKVGFAGFLEWATVAWKRFNAEKEMILSME